MWPPELYVVDSQIYVSKGATNNSGLPFFIGSVFCRRQGHCPVSSVLIDFSSLCILRRAHEMKVFNRLPPFLAWLLLLIGIALAANFLFDRKLAGRHLHYPVVNVSRTP